MADSRVAVYIDFDNMVISRYDAVHKESAWRADNARQHVPNPESSDEVDRKLAEALIDIGAIIDYASSFGTVALTRAYADWSVPANAAYKGQLVDRAVELVQLFATSGTKNGADIRLSIDALEDLFRHADLTHVVVVGGDSDYIGLAQRCKKLGRYVVGIGVAGSISGALKAACDEFTEYADVPGVEEPVRQPVAKKAPAKKATAKKTTKKAATKSAASPKDQQATNLLIRAIRVGLQKSDDEWLYTGGVKSQMQRMDSTFKEKSLGFSSFRAFVESRSDVVETREKNNQLLVRLR